MPFIDCGMRVLNADKVKQIYLDPNTGDYYADMDDGSLINLGRMYPEFLYDLCNKPEQAHDNN